MDAKNEGTRLLTAGESAVGLNFNLSDNPEVHAIKRAMAHVFDLVEQSVPAYNDDPSLEASRKRKMRDAALHEIVTAQMWAVKVVTLGSKS